MSWDSLSMSGAASFAVALVCCVLIAALWGLVGALALAWLDRDGQIQAWALSAPARSLRVLLVLLWPVLAVTALIMLIRRRIYAKR